MGENLEIILFQRFNNFFENFLIYLSSFYQYYFFKIYTNNLLYI